MFTSYLKTALRSIRRHKLFSFISIFGLSLSLAFCMLVIVMYNDQTGFDRFHTDADDVYRINTIAHRKGGELEPYASSPLPLGGTVQRESPSVIAVARLARVLDGESTNGLSPIRLEGFLTDEGFFDVFGFQLESGDPRQVFSQPNSLVLTAKTAERLFGSTDVMGKTVSLKGGPEFVVTGVLKPPRGRSHLEFDMLGSLALAPVLEQEGRIPMNVTDNWTNYYFSYTYVRLRHGSSTDNLRGVLDGIPSRYISNLKLETRDEGYSFELQPLTGITPGPMLSNNLGRGMPREVLMFLGVLTLLGMFAALVNYSNLTLARSFARAKEVGIRKVVGAARQQLFAQFIVESVVTSFLALVLAELVLRLVLTPAFQGLSIVQKMDIQFGTDGKVYLLFAGFTFAVGLLAGVLPAMAISGFRPTVILKDLSHIKVFSMVTPRKILVVLQFVLSLVLMIVLNTVYSQLRYAIGFEKGFDFSRLLSVQLQGNPSAIVAHEVEKNPQVAATCAISHLPGTWEDSSVELVKQPGDEPVTVRDYSVDERFLDCFGLKLLAGSNFSSGTGHLNGDRIIVNERFLERFKLGPPADAVGATLMMEGKSVQIAGIVKDFRFKPANYAIAPLILRYDPASWRILILKTQGHDTPGLLSSLKTTWQSIDAVHPLNARTYRDVVVGVYAEFSDMVSVFGFLSFVALVISMLGLLGMVVYNAERRIKEIGIRKVLGAGAKNLILVLARTELLMLVIATAIAVPVSLWLSSMLLQPIAYRIELGPGLVLGAVLTVYGLTALIILWQTLRATRVNPVEALRYE